VTRRAARRAAPGGLRFINIPNHLKPDKNAGLQSICAAFLVSKNMQNALQLVELAE
jgi:hypothetical protein